MPAEAAEEQNETILDAVTAAYESLENEDDPAPDPDPSPDTDPEPAADTDTDPVEPVPGDEPEPEVTTDDEPVPVEDADPEPAPIENAAPEHWAAEDREMYAKQTPEAQAWLTKRHAEMESHFTQQTQENSNIIKEYEPVRAIMSPFRTAMANIGLSESDVIRRWAAAENSLNTNPIGAIKQLAATYGVNLSQLNESQPKGADPYFDGNEQQDNPKVTALQNDVTALTNTIQNDRLSQANQQIDAFKSTMDDAGNAKYPYFDELVADITQLAAVARQSGQQVSLNDLYEKAVWANTTTRDKLLTSQRNAEAETTKARVAQQTRLKKEKAERAKVASKSIRPSTEVAASGGGANNKNSTLRQDIEAAYDKASGNI